MGKEAIFNSVIFYLNVKGKDTCQVVSRKSWFVDHYVVCSYSKINEITTVLAFFSREICFLSLDLFITAIISDIFTDG